MTCQDLLAKLMDYLDGEMVEEERTVARTHLGECENCTVYLETYTHTVKVVRRLPKCGPLPEALTARLRQRVDGHLRDGTAE